MFALIRAKTDERTPLLSMLDTNPARPGQIIIAGKAYYGHDFETELESQGLVLLRKARKGETARPRAQFFKLLRQVIEPINAALKTYLNIEHHRRRTITGVITRILAQLRPDRHHLAQRPPSSSNQTITNPLRQLTHYDH